MNRALIKHKPFPRSKYMEDLRILREGIKEPPMKTHRPIVRFWDRAVTFALVLAVSVVGFIVADLIGDAMTTLNSIRLQERP